LTRVIRASGQGIRPDFMYSGNYDDVVEFGVVTLKSALGLINALPPYSREAFDAELCPPTISLTDPSGNTLTVSRSVDGGFDIYFSGPHSGDVASNASLEEVREIVTRFFTGIYPEAVDYVKATGEVPGVKKKDLLAYMPLYEYYDPFDVGGGREISFHVWREESGHTYIEIDEEGGGGVIRIPLNYVTEVVLKRGGLFKGARIEVRFISEDGRVGKIVRRVDSKNRDWIPRVAAELAQVIPGRVRVE